MFYRLSATHATNNERIIWILNAEKVALDLFRFFDEGTGCALAYNPTLEYVRDDGTVAHVIGYDNPRTGMMRGF